MNTRWTMRGLLVLGAIVLAATLVIIPTAIVSADPTGNPTVDGSYYNDAGNYILLAEAPAGRGTLYYNQDGTTLYVAMVVSTSVNDNVFGAIGGPQPGDGADEAYVKSADWSGGGGGQGKEHTAETLITSDHIELYLSCGGDTWTWKQDYAYQDEGVWRSDPSGGDGDATTTPPGLVSSSSFVWNMITSTWDATLTGTRSSADTWKSVDEDDDNDVKDEGYPQYNTMYNWEWPMVYEMSMDVSQCTDSWELDVLSAHNSPSKDDNEDVVIKLGKITIIKDVYDVNKGGIDFQDDQDFLFESDQFADFFLDDYVTSTTTLSSTTFLNLDAGTYTFTETALTGWGLRDIECTESISTGGSYTDTSTYATGIYLGAGEVATCTFVNEPTNGGITAVGVSSFSAESGIGGLTILVAIMVLGLSCGTLVYIRRRVN